MDPEARSHVAAAHDGHGECDRAGAEAVRLVGDVSPDVVVMDIRMPGIDGIEATRLITAAPATTRVLVLTPRPG